MKQDDEPFHLDTLERLGDLCFQKEISQSCFEHAVTSEMAKVLFVVKISGLRDRVIIEKHTITHQPIAIYVSLQELRDAWPVCALDWITIWHRHCDKIRLWTMEHLTHILHEMKCEEPKVFATLQTLRRKLWLQTSFMQKTTQRVRARKAFLDLVCPPLRHTTRFTTLKKLK